MEAPEMTLYTAEQAAKILGMARATFYRAHKAKKIPHRLLPGTNQVRFTPADLEQYISDAYRPAA